MSKKDVVYAPGLRLCALVIETLQADLMRPDLDADTRALIEEEIAFWKTWYSRAEEN